MVLLPSMHLILSVGHCHNSQTLSVYLWISLILLKHTNKHNPPASNLRTYFEVSLHLCRSPLAEFSTGSKPQRFQTRCKTQPKKLWMQTTSHPTDYTKGNDLKSQVEKDWEVLKQNMLKIQPKIINRWYDTLKLYSMKKQYGPWCQKTANIFYHVFKRYIFYCVYIHYGIQGSTSTEPF